MISIRRAAGSVKVLGVGFDELTRAERQETVFHCSDELLNRFWEIGRQTLRRSAAFVPLAESRADNDCYMLDAYIDAVNMAAVFGDYEYANARLQQFVDAQLENGDIPALTFGTRHASQVHQLFFFPVWIYGEHHAAQGDDSESRPDAGIFRSDDRRGDRAADRCGDPVRLPEQNQFRRIQGGGDSNLSERAVLPFPALFG